MAQLRAQRSAAEARELRRRPRHRPRRSTGWRERADNMAKTSAVLKQIADTGAPLYMSLNDAQKERFKKLARMLRPHHHHMHARDRG